MYVLNLLRNLPPILLSIMIHEDWFKIKRYPHIGLPITTKDYNWVKNYVNDPNKISKHSFLPFIHKTILKRKFRTDPSNATKNKSGKRYRIKQQPKIRDTFFASHIDAMVFSKYNIIISEAYEEYIKSKPFNESIVAYRKIPIIEGKKGNKCNIDFAKTVFEYILSNKNKKLTVIVADIKSFFDNLDHKILKKQWIKVLGKKTLPPDHYNLYKALTRIKYIESQQLFEAYNKTMLVSRGIPNSASETEYKRKSLNDTRYFKEKNAVAYCNKEEFIKNNLSLIISKNNERGIPQGSPISATLANIYMLDLDDKLFGTINKINGFYQRYSDDLIIVCEQKYESFILKEINEAINNDTVKLTIEPKKYKIYHFELFLGSFKGFVFDDKTKKAKIKKPLEYLGFVFDGQIVLIKNSGFAKFYRSMKHAFNRASGFALNSKNPDKSIFKARLYKRFTYKGAGRKLKFRPSTTDPKKYVRTKEYSWGNYLTYIYKADDAMEDINTNHSIKKQSRKMWSKFNNLMKYHVEKVENHKNGVVRIEVRK